ncbi:hypothetical protein TNCV_3852821 [Trichonephila clavipes]|nr:hypothetical protein TNCV_3852821 [Trichonephila clavipes]
MGEGTMIRIIKVFNSIFDILGVRNSGVSWKGSREDILEFRPVWKRVDGDVDCCVPAVTVEAGGFCWSDEGVTRVVAEPSDGRARNILLGEWAPRYMLSIQVSGDEDVSLATEDAVQILFRERFSWGAVSRYDGDWIVILSGELYGGSFKTIVINNYLMVRDAPFDHYGRASPSEGAVGSVYAVVWKGEVMAGLKMGFL